MTMKRSASPTFGEKRFASKQVQFLEDFYGQKFTRDLRKAIITRFQLAFEAGVDQCQRAERSRRKQQTATATAVRAGAAARRYQSIAADFHRRSERYGIEARLAATARKMGVHVNTVRTALKRYP